MQLPEELELILLIKKRASVLIFLNTCINLVFKIQQSQNKYRLLALYHFITSGECQEELPRKSEPRHRVKRP